MNDAKYIGLDVHQATISVAVLDSTGKLVMEAILETKTETILQFLRGLRGGLHVTLEEGTWAGWLHDLLKPMSHEWSCVIRGRLVSESCGIKMTEVTPENWPIFCIGTGSNRFTTKSTVSGRYGNWHAVTYR